jgi:predicted permease
MRTLKRLVARIWNFSAGRRGDARLHEEIEAHIAMQAEDNVRAGMPPAEARRQAVLKLGAVEAIREQYLAEEGLPLLEHLLQDLRYALRQLRKSPGFAATAVITLALGIGANAVVFSVLNALVLRPLNVDQPGRLFAVEHKEHASYMQSYPDYIDYRDDNRTFSGMASYETVDVAVVIGTSAAKSYGYLASGNYFDTLGVQPAVGRFFHASDEHGTNSAPYIVLSYDFWRSRFNENPKVIGTTVSLNTHPFTVIGIAPSDFHGTETFFWPDCWIPLVDAAEIGESPHFLGSRATHNLWILGRLKPTVTPEQASDDLNAISRRLAQQYPKEDDDLDARLVRPGLMGDVWGDPIRSFLAAIMIMSGLVLLAACANLGSIFAVRAADRTRELAVRLAIGASRGRILHALVTEAVLVSVAGGITGTLFASILLTLLSRWQPFVDYPIHVVALPDARVYFLALLLSVASGLFFGLLPARQIWQTDAAQAMKVGTVAGPVLRRFSMRDALLCVQIALCTLLVMGSFVAFRGMERSLHTPLGFHPQGVTIAETQLNMGGYTEAQAWPVQKRMAEEAAQIPGVSSAGLIDRVMLDNDCCGSESVFRQGTTDFRSSEESFDAHNFSVSPGYFAASGTHLLAGRDISWHDDASSPRVAVVNATFAHLLFGSSPAVGQHFELFGGHLMEIVGVVEDGKYETLTEAPQPAMFFPLVQEMNSNDTALVVRSARRPMDMAAALYRMMDGINPNIPLTVRTWPEVLDLALFPARAATGALVIMGLLAAMLAVTGIFGMAAYSVNRRMKELGIRVALGARKVQLINAALGPPILLLCVGSGLGLVGGILASGLLKQIVYQASSGDPMVLAGAVFTMALLGLAASAIPARRALSIDPSSMMREE